MLFKLEAREIHRTHDANAGRALLAQRPLRPGKPDEPSKKLKSSTRLHRSGAPSTKRVATSRHFPSASVAESVKVRHGDDLAAEHE
eukprot:101816-Pleurochrysis_carterae.AAC.1